jgi:predicted HicB family RNase H-like nuclease
METLRYKGFIGSIEAEVEENTLYGKVLGLNKGTLVTYEGQTLAELKEDFIKAVDDYIAHCKENGIPLHKSYSGSFNIRIPSELHAKIAAMAQENGISLNTFVKESLVRAVML